MAIWGPKLYESDCTSDIRDEFLKLMDSGIPPDQAKQRILSIFAEAFSDSDEGDSARLALAALLWSVGALSKVDRLEILSFLKAGGDILFWSENAPQFVDLRKKELKRLEKRFSSPTTGKTIRRSKAKQFSWEIGQIYAFPIHDASESLSGIQNEYILLYFYSEAEAVNGYRVLLAWAKITQTGKLPGDAKEFNELPYIQIACTATENRFMPFANVESLPQEYVQEYVPDEWGYLPEYSMMIYESRGNHPPKDMQLLGAFEGVDPPKYNYRRYKSAHGAAWRYLEEYILQGYRLHNLHQAQL